MTSDNTTPSATASSHQRQDPRTCPHSVTTDAFHHYRQPPQSEALPCPRCDSNNTKFCYYNNYNLSQPRHFCKSCRRYWTHGGTLRNVPVGGGTRKSTSSVSYPSFSNKRPRSSPSAVSPCSSSSAVSGHDGPPGTKLQEAGPGTAPDGVNAGGVLGSGFTSQLSPPGSNTFLALGGYGPTLDGLGRGVWPFAEAGFMEGGMYGSFHGAMAVPAGMETWHVGPGGGGDGDGEGGDGGGSREAGEGLAWPELAISMPGQRMK